MTMWANGLTVDWIKSRLLQVIKGLNLHYAMIFDGMMRTLSNQSETQQTLFVFWYEEQATD